MHIYETNYLNTRFYINIEHSQHNHIFDHNIMKTYTIRFSENPKQKTQTTQSKFVMNTQSSATIRMQWEIKHRCKIFISISPAVALRCTIDPIDSPSWKFQQSRIWESIQTIIYFVLSTQRAFPFATPLGTSLTLHRSGKRCIFSLRRRCRMWTKCMCVLWETVKLYYKVMYAERHHTGRFHPENNETLPGEQWANQFANVEV